MNLADFFTLLDRYFQDASMTPSQIARDKQAIGLPAYENLWNIDAACRRGDTVAVNQSDIDNLQHLMSLTRQIPKRPTHDELVTALVKDPKIILEQLTPEKMNLLHMAIGVSGEGGELLDWVKKLAIYNQSLDTVSKEGRTLEFHILEELSDAWFYMKGIMLQMGWKLTDLEAFNTDKLLERYNGMQYSDAAAKARKDKE